MSKTFIWIFNHFDFSVVDILEVADYSIQIDEETNAKSTIKVLKQVSAKANDIVALKKDNNILYWGIIEEINNDSGNISYTYTLKYLTNIFNQKIALQENINSQIEEGFYRFKAVIDGNSNIAVRNGSKDNQAVVQVWEKNKLTQGVWQLIRSGTHYLIKNINSDLFLDVSGRNYTTRGTTICQSTNGCLWDFVRYQNGVYYIALASDNNYVIDIDNGVIANGTKIQIWDNVELNQINRRFYLEKTTEPLIWELGIEDFIKNEIDRNFIFNEDIFVNKNYLEVIATTHTKLDTSVSNVEDGIYNLHTYMTNCTQNYNIVYKIKITNRKLLLEICHEEINKEVIDTKAMNITNYQEVFETDIVSKVVVLTSSETYKLYLKSDRTTTTDMNSADRAVGKTVTIYCENIDDAPQQALNEIQKNSYNHNITFKYDKYLKIGTPIAIKTLQSLTLNTYISSIKFYSSNFFEYQCGNIRVNFLEKIMKERK